MVSDSSTGSFHVYYASKTYYNNGKLICMLDLDDTSSYGPETTTLYNSPTGIYTFYVHNYSGESILSTSEAYVRVYLGGNSYPAYTFNVPNDSGMDWNVFKYNSATNTIVPLNSMR